MAVQFPAEETIIGYVDTDSGGLLITDAAWESALPRATHKHTAIDFGDIPSCRIPVYAKLVGGRRFVIIDIDAAQDLKVDTDTVAIDSPADLPPPDEEEKKDNA